ncbi:Calx-beta domain-containing protein [Aliisedimentitalea scapharcae]|uniref:Calx-beta domain-containing protein n=1 Tax=Aliisedimentitalea scapharcae TaxID=1524259 RepID=A0ABZ2XZI0_9RHOB
MTYQIIGPSSASVAEGRDIIFAVTRTNTNFEILTLNTISGGSYSENDGDHSIISNQWLMFNTGETSKFVTISTTDDTRFEGDELFALQLSEDSYYPPRLASYITRFDFTIVDNDSEPAVYSFGPVPDILEGNSGTKTVELTIERSGNLQAETVYYRTVDGTATRFQDFGFISSEPVSFGAGETQKTISFDIFGDRGLEPDEVFQIALGSSASDTSRLAEVDVTIFSDDLVSFQFSDGDDEVVLTDTGPHRAFDGNDSVSGTEAGDDIRGGDGNDRLVGAGGNDSLDGGPGADTLNGGDGDDVILGGVARGDLRDVIYAGAGDDSIDAGAGNDQVFGQAGNDTIAGGAGVDDLQGQDGDDVITGSAFSDLVFGGAGNDFVNGGFGHDRINGGTGADKFFHVGIADHGSDWVQDYVAADGDVLLWGGGAATASNFQVNLAHTANAAGERSGNDGVQEAFVIYKPTEQIIWALVDGGGQSSINIQIGGDTFDLLV